MFICQGGGEAHPWQSVDKEGIYSKDLDCMSPRKKNVSVFFLI